MQELHYLLTSPLGWLGAAAGLVAGIVVVLLMLALRRGRRRNVRASAAVLLGAMAIGGALGLGYEAWLTARVADGLARERPAEDIITVTSHAFEFRSVGYGSREELLQALRAGAPAPGGVAISWFAVGGDERDREAAIANVEVARAAAKEAGLRVKEAVIGTESFGSKGARP